MAALNPFLILTFADLKKYRYWYWCGFPALLQKPGWETAGEWQSLDSAFSPQEVLIFTPRLVANVLTYTA